jgi:hypothetical protein
MGPARTVVVLAPPLPSFEGVQAARAAVVISPPRPLLLLV